MPSARPLQPGDRIGIAAPASPFDRARFTRGIGALRALGFEPVYRSDIFDQNRYLAGTDARRAEEFLALVEDPSIAAVMFARGGYGSQRVIPLLDAARIAQHPKPVIGFSDLTALLAFLRQAAELPTFYGPVITQLGRKDAALSIEMLGRALTDGKPLGALPMQETRTITPGEARGALVGGCLSLINSSIGTPYELRADGAILFLEDTGEKVYVLDRMLTQLKNSGMLARAAGVVFGSLVPPEEEPHDVETMIRDVLADFPGPVVMDFPAGHTTDFVTLPLGCAASLIAPAEGAPQLSIEGSPFAEGKD